jgi:DNA-binding transcriptional regulator YiaG
MTRLTPEVIRTTRARLGLTQAQFAERIGCSALAVSFWERGTRSPKGLYAKAVHALVDEADQVAVMTLAPQPPER